MLNVLMTAGLMDGNTSIPPAAPGALEGWMFVGSPLQQTCSFMNSSFQTVNGCLIVQKIINAC